jgi:5-aminopentanamidase
MWHLRGSSLETFEVNGLAGPNNGYSRFINHPSRYMNHRFLATFCILMLVVPPFVLGKDAEPNKVPNSIRIAVVQQEANPGKPEQNRTKALRFAAEALEKGADIILFHEALCVGYVPDPRSLAEPLNGPTTRAFQDVLHGQKALIIYGLTERDGDKYYISATVVSAAGVVTNYHKTHLWWDATGARHEPTFYSAGDRLVTFEFRGHRCGLMICYDGDFPEMTRAYANRGCSILFWLNQRGSRGHPEVKDLASRNSMIMATSCNCGANESGDNCPGGSNITDVFGNLLAEIWDHEGIILKDVFPADVPKLRDKNPWYHGQRPELYR